MMATGITLTKPLTVDFLPLAPEMAADGLDALAHVLQGSGELPTEHPLAQLLRAAEDHHPACDPLWGLSPVVSYLAHVGIQLEMLGQRTDVAELVARAVKDPLRWDAHVYEAVVAWVFHMAGAEVELVEQGQTGRPDVVVRCGPQEYVVECRRCRAFDDERRRDRILWSTAANDVLRMVQAALPNCIVAFTASRAALVGDGDLIRGAAEAWILEYEALRPAPRNATLKSGTTDGLFHAHLIVPNDADQAFGCIATGSPPGIEVPWEADPFSLSVNLDSTPPGLCEAIWYVAIRRQAEWSVVEESVLRRLDEKAKQLRKVSTIRAGAARGILWIEDPSLMSATPEQMASLRARVRGKLESVRSRQYAQIAAVVVHNSRMVLDRMGRCRPQHRFVVVTREQEEQELAEVPVLGRASWLSAPDRDWRGHRIGLAALPDL